MSSGLLGAAKGTEQRIHLWWLSSANNLVKAIYAPSTASEDEDVEWSEADSLVLGDMAPASNGFLAVSQSGPSTTDLFWATENGRLYAMKNGNLYSFADTDHGIDRIENVFFKSRMATLNIPQGDFRVFWVAKDGNVLMGTRPSGAESTAWTISLVARPGSAAPDSNMAAAILPSSKTANAPLEPRVWWFGSDTQILCARPVKCKLGTVYWDVGEQMPKMVGREMKRKTLIARINEEGTGVKVWCSKNNSTVNSFTVF